MFFLYIYFCFVELFVVIEGCVFIEVVFEVGVVDVDGKLRVICIDFGLNMMIVFFGGVFYI